MSHYAAMAVRRTYFIRQVDVCSPDDEHIHRDDVAPAAGLYQDRPSHLIAQHSTAQHSTEREGE
jgi:hypothetical protein